MRFLFFVFYLGKSIIGLLNGSTLLAPVDILADLLALSVGHLLAHLLSHLLTLLNLNVIAHLNKTNIYSG